MAPKKVLVISPSESLRTWLSNSLSPARFCIWHSCPGSEVLPAVLSVRPQIAVVDGIDARPEAAQLEIALVKSVCPEARIIALSGHSSGADAPVLEQGVFYYMAATSNGDLVRVLESAAGPALPGRHEEAGPRSGRAFTLGSEEVLE